MIKNEVFPMSNWNGLITKAGFAQIYPVSYKEIPDRYKTILQSIRNIRSFDASRVDLPQDTKSLLDDPLCSSVISTIEEISMYHSFLCPSI